LASHEFQDELFEAEGPLASTSARRAAPHSEELIAEKWLDANAARLVSIATESGTPVELVHIVAVLVLAGLSDAAIRRELWLLEFRYRTHEPLEAAKLGVTLQVVRELLEMTGTG
jgi:hypothetical protein